MSGFLLMLTVVMPLVLVACWPVGRCRGWFGRLAMFAPLPAIFLVIFGDDVTVDLPWLLLGSRWGLDSTGRVFLGFTALLWLAAGIFARSYLAYDAHRERFELFWLLTLSGNLGVIVAQDMVSFLLLFGLMSLAAYGLITHDRNPESLRAGRTYIALTVCGEVLLFWALILTVQETGSLYFEGLANTLAASPLRNVIAGLLLAGFGIKLGVMPLHFWLPLAHPAAPTPASAVLSGAIIKTGLLGLLRFLPLGAVAMHEWGCVCMVTGIASAFIAVLIGLTQDNPKTVLAYSSVSQMGLVSIGIGAALMAPEAWPVVAVAILLFAAHHAIAKGSLFLGVGVAHTSIPMPWRRNLVTVGLVIAALSLAGLPLTSGFAAKIGLKYAAGAMPKPWATALRWILPVTGITTVLLVSRFLYLVWPSRQRSHDQLASAMAVPWGILTAGVIVLFIALRSCGFVKPTWVSLDSKQISAAAWPIIAAGTILLVLRVRPSLRERLQRIHIPAGDLVVPLTIVITRCRGIWNTFAVSGVSVVIATVQRRVARWITPVAQYLLDRIQRGLENDLTAGVLIGVLVVAMFILTVLV